MASIGSLLSRGSLVPNGAGGWKVQLSTKFKWEEKRLRQKVGEARAKALKNVGLLVKGKTQREMSNRAPRKRPVNVKIGTRFGFDLIAQIERVPKSDRVTSWKTARHPKGFLRQDVQSDYDFKSGSVVVGPAKRPAINQLLEFGGPSKRYFVPIAKRSRGKKVYGYLANVPPRIKGTRDRQSGLYSFNTTIKPRGFMAKGLKVSLAKIPAQFKDQIKGP